MIPVVLPSGEVEVDALLDAAVPHAWAVVALAHGAGAGMEHPFLGGLAGALADAGVTTLRFVFPYRQAGRRMPGPATHAVATWAAVGKHISRVRGDLPWFAAGKSYGGRMASLAAADGSITPAGLVYVGYPFHPPGSPEKTRAAHLPSIPAPQLFLAGTDDPFLQPLDQFAAAVDTCRDAEILWTPRGGHSFDVKGVKRSGEAVGAELAASIVPWLRARSHRPAA